MPKNPTWTPEDLIEHLTGFLHVSRHSDGFGFDLLAWIARDADDDGRPTAVEVKGSADSSFFLSPNGLR
jgi:hypothetical protein